MKEIVLDAEFDSLFNPKRIWCVVCKDIQSGRRRKFLNVDHNSDKFIQYISKAEKIIGHNVLEYDLEHLYRICPSLPRGHYKVFDTLVVSRYLDYAIPGGHSLNAWGQRLGIKKEWADVTQEFFNQFSKELVDRCVSDVDITEALYKLLLSKLSDGDKNAVSVEHSVALICKRIQDHGFYFNHDQAISLHEEIKNKIDLLTHQLQTDFPPRSRMIREIMPKATKSGAIHLGDFRWLPEPRDMTPFEVGAPFSRFKWEPFNPGSKKQIIERLNDAGWKPREKTKGHIDHIRERSSHGYDRKRNEVAKRKDFKDRKGTRSHDRVYDGKAEYFRKFGWKVNETNLATLPSSAPVAARRLADWIILDSRRSTLEEWLKAYDSRTGRIHGRINHIGSWTHRRSHNSPNLANIPRASNPVYGRSFRECFCVPEGRLLVGVDATGIQLRVLAHYINDPEFTREVTEGDVHELNKRTLGVACKSRANAKTFIYAWLLGAGTGKVSEILGCSQHTAKDSVNRFVERYPGLKKLKRNIIPRDARRGFFIGFDGRQIKCTSEHLMLSGYLQAGESIIMKHAQVEVFERLTREGIPFWYVDDIHDEVQIETLDDWDLGVYIGETVVEAIENAGKKLNLNVPFTGEYKLGYNWYATH